MSGPNSKAQRENILIVDDAPANLRLLSQMLSELGYGVRAATSGERALASVHAAPPDLILLDIKMPGMNGYEVCERLKADRTTREIPVIFISALDEVQDKVQAFTAGGVDYITKPFNFEEVLVRTETHLSLRRLQNQLREANRKLLDANQRMQRELGLAGKVQASFLPGELPALAGWQIAATLKPARQTSGDFYDLIELPDGRLGLLVADVVDKGVAAALFMALSWILVRTYALEFPSQPERVLGAVNQRILAETDTGQFVTVFYGILDPETGNLTYCNAGHPPPLLLGNAHDGALEALTKTEMALGVVATETWEQATVEVSPGALLALYSDGVTDATNEAGVSFGIRQLEAVLRGCLGCPAQKVQEALIAEIEAFVGGAISLDDITSLIVVREA